MKTKLYEKFVKDRTVAYWLALAAAAVMLITDIIFIATDLGDRTFSLVTFFLVLLGVIIEVVYAVLDISFLDFLPTLSDVWNGVIFVGGNPQAALAFGIIFLIGTITALVSCFMKQKKNN